MARNAFLSWLELQGHFQRAVRFLPGSNYGEPQPQSDPIWREAARAVNAAIPEAQWAASWAHARLKRYLEQFEDADRVAKGLGINWAGGRRSGANGLVGDKLEKKCPLYFRLERLHRCRGVVDLTSPRERPSHQKERARKAEEESLSSMGLHEREEEDQPWLRRKLKRVKRFQEDKSGESPSQDAASEDSDTPLALTKSVMNRKAGRRTPRASSTAGAVSEVRNAGQAPSSARKATRPEITQAQSASSKYPTEATQRKSSNSTPRRADQPSTPREPSPHNGKRSPRVDEPAQAARVEPAAKPQSIKDPNNPLRLAIAEVVSQREQLVSSRTTPRGRPSLSELSSDNNQDEQGPRSQMDGHRIQHHDQREDFVLGFQPLLFDPPTSESRDHSNLERKRTYLHAKQLAFEQMQWCAEHELQQREVSLLRKEMETREILAHNELKLRQLHLRADTMVPMILDGASPADIAERLKML